MKILKWLLYIILFPLWLVIGISRGLFDSFEIGYDVIFGEVKTYDQLSKEEKGEEI